jgi:altronate hydrolase
VAVVSGELIRLHPSDTVAVCRRAVATGERLCSEAGELAALEPVPQGHKIALYTHQPGELVIKYGHPIGEATVQIAAGSHVHVHNLRTIRVRLRSET